MRKFTIVISVLIAAMTISPSLWAKKKRTRKKKKINQSEWLKKKEDLTTKQLRNLIEENHQLKTQQEELDEKATSAQEELARLRRLREKINALRKARGLEESDDDLDLEALFKQEEQKLKQKTEPGEFSKEDWAIDENGKPYVKGTSFKVQIGAYKNRDLSQVLEQNEGIEAFEQETVEGLHIFTIRHFRNYWKANKFKKEVRAMGIKDAYIVCFVNGKRVPLKSVLDQVRAQKK